MGDLIHHAQELDQVADLMEGPDIGVADDDAAAALEIVGKQAAVASALGVFGHHQMLFLELGGGGSLVSSCSGALRCSGLRFAAEGAQSGKGRIQLLLQRQHRDCLPTG